jgi:alkyldihydroxyacetonephosphate synthase
MFALRYGQLERCVDCVVFINSHEQAVLVVELAMKHDVVLIPYGGGTNVTWALKCRKDEPRMIVMASDEIC